MQEAMAGTMAGTEGLFAMVAAWLALTAVRVTVWLAAVFVGAWLLRRSAARVRRWLYGLGLAGALLLAVAPVLPALEWEVLPPNQQKPTAAEIRKIIEDRHRPTPRDEGRLIHEKLALAPELPRSAANNVLGVGARRADGGLSDGCFGSRRTADSGEPACVGAGARGETSFACLACSPRHRGTRKRGD
jgi:hypothetical protein